MDVPRLDRKDPLGWILKISQFFTTDLNCIILSRWPIIKLVLMDVLEQPTYFMDKFLHALQLRFGPSHFDDPQGSLFQLTQTTTDKDNQI